MAEFFDVLDSSGNITGQTKLRSDVHRDGDWHRSFHLWIVNPKGQLLIQKRAANKDSYPNMWDISAAGHVSAGETSLTAGVREAKEELGLDLQESVMEKLFTTKEEVILNDGTFINNEFDDVYLAEIDVNPRELTFPEAEISELKMTDFKVLEKLLRSNNPDFVPKSESYYDNLFKVLQERYNKN